MFSNVLVIGSAGQLASEIRSRTVGDKRFIFVGRQEISKNRHSGNQGIARIMEEVRPKAVINCAAYTAVDRAEEEMGHAFALNRDLVGELAQFAEKSRVYLVHISTDFVFDGQKNSPYVETDEAHPLSIYGKSKLAGEQVLINSGCRGSIIRTSWLYSKFGNNFVKTISRAARERPELRVVCDQVGSPTYAGDLAQLIIDRIEDLNFERPEVLHFSNEGVASWYDFAHETLAAQGIRTRLKPILTNEYPTQAQRPHYSVMSKVKVKDLLGIQIPHWRDSLRECLHDRTAFE